MRRSLVFVVFAAALAAPRAAGAVDVVYLNRCVGNCQVTAGPDSALARTSTIPPGNATLTEFPFSTATFDATAACVRGLLAKYAISVVTVDPGIARREVILAGVATQLGQPSGTIAVSPTGIKPDVLTFVFAQTVGDDSLLLCQLAAQQVGFTYGLDFVTDCHDAMGFTFCSPRAFTNVAAQCGDNAPRTCWYGGTTQNSDVLMSQRAGLAEIFGDSFE